MAGKTQWNLTKMGFAPSTKANGAITEFEAIHVQLGAITCAITPNDSTGNRQAGDGGVFYNGGGASSYNIDLTCAKFDRWFKTNVLGMLEDGSGLGIGAGEKKSVAFLAEASTDQGGKRFVFYDVTSTPISTTYQTNDVDGNYTFAEESVTLTATIVELPNGESRVGWECETGDEDYEGFWTTVYYAPAESPEP